MSRLKTLQKALKKDKSTLNYRYLFHLFPGDTEKVYNLHNISRGLIAKSNIKHTIGWMYQYEQDA